MNGSPFDIKVKRFQQNNNNMNEDEKPKIQHLFHDYPVHIFFIRLN